MTGGTGAELGKNGDAAGGSIFLQGGLYGRTQAFTFAPGAGQVETVSGVIADFNGSLHSGAVYGESSLVVNGPGTLVLAANNEFSGGIVVEQGTLVVDAPDAGAGEGFTIDSGTLELASSTEGSISFAQQPTGPATIVIDAAATPADGQDFPNGISNFNDDDAIDIKGMTYAPGATAIALGGWLTVTSDGQSIQFVDVNYNQQFYYAHNDGSGGVLVNDIPPPPNAWAGPVSADWNVAADWANAVVPTGPTGDAAITVAGTYTVKVAAGESDSLRSLVIDNPTATFDLAGTMNLTGALTLTAGLVQLDHGGVLNGAASIAAAGAVVGYGTISGAVQNAGSITVSGGKLKVGGALSGASGVITLNKGATLEIGGAVAAGATIAIAAGITAVIELDSPMTMAGTITGFGAGDTIDLKRVTVKLANYANGVLSLFGQSPFFGYPQVASLAIPMPFATPAFTLSSDHDGGTDVKFAPAAPPTIAAPAAKTVTAKAVTPIAGLSIADNAAATAGQTLTVTLTDKKGLLSASAIGGGAVTGAGTEALTITGSLGEVNSDLATLTYVESKAGTDRITIGAMNSGGGIAKSQNVAITVTAAPASLNPALFIQAIAAFGPTEAWLTGRADGLALEQRHLDLSVRP